MNQYNKLEDEIVNLDRLIDEREAADLLCYSVRALQNWRHRGGGPKFVKVRDDDGRSMPMTAYMIVRRDLFDRMQSIYPKAKMVYRSKKPMTRHKVINKIADWLRDHADGDIPASVVDEALGTRCRSRTKQLAEDKDGILAGAGYHFVAGRKGRGASESKFIQMS